MLTFAQAASAIEVDEVAVEAVAVVLPEEEEVLHVDEALQEEVPGAVRRVVQRSSL